jgi:MarR family transcriptional regulator, negative regulator of the multidrug operon emrRAB
LSDSSEDRLANLLGAAVLAAGDRMRAAVEQELGVGGAAPAALVHVAAYPGVSTEALHRVLGISQPGTVQLVERLVAQGLVERRPGRDRRTQALHATARGHEALAALLARRAEALATLLAPLSPTERDALTPLLEKVVAGLADDRPHALTACRLCDRDACRRGPGCPLGHTVKSARR